MEAELAERPGDAYACAKLGGLELSEGRRERGLDLLHQGLQTCGPDDHPERYELLLHLAIAETADNPAAAAARYREALALPLPPQLTLAARLNLATLLLEQPGPDPAHSLQEAAGLAQSAAAAAPELPQGWRSLGLIERRRGRIAEAIAAYRRSLALEPEHPDTEQNLAAALLLGGDIEGARRGFGRAIALLQAHGRSSEAQALRQQAGALVKLDA